MGDETANNTNPRSMRQKRILDAAESHSEASIEELASLVPSATPTQIELILEEYGDPAAEIPDSDHPDEAEPSDATTVVTEEQSENTGETHAARDADPEESKSEKHPQTAPEALGSITDLSCAQREVLREVADDPTATQDTIGDRLGISGSTVSNRVKDIPGFDWRNRESFITDIMTDSGSTAVVSDGGVAQDVTPTESEEPTDSANEDMAGAISEIQSSLDQIETTLDSITDTSSGNSQSNDPGILQDPELVHRVVHACIESDAISEAEELEILRAVLT